MPMATPEAQRKYQREWIAKRRATYLADKSCVRCQAKDNLEVNHIDPALKLSHKVWSWNEERRMTELAKCEVLCTECHKSETARQRHEKVQHGTRTMYEDHGCRCLSCKECKRKHNALRYSKSRLLSSTDENTAFVTQ